jgi:hypothetical protein
MKLETFNLAGINYALVSINSQPGGYVGRGKTAQEAINNAIDLVISCE